MPKCAAPSGIKVNGVKIEHLDKKTMLKAFINLIYKHNELKRTKG